VWALKIAYVQKTSFIDYPGMISAIVFTQGCNFRCPFCHNPELVIPALYGDIIGREEVLTYLEKRRGKLDAVVITGGEPTLQNGIVEFMRRVKSLGYLLKLDTNGSRPQVLRNILSRGLADYVAMDIKAPLEKYAQVAGALVNITDIRDSIAALMGSGIAHEFRTTLVRSLIDPEDVMRIAGMIEGAPLYALQRFVSSKHVDKEYASQRSFSEDEVKRLVAGIQGRVGRCIVR
jgi:pyruvate formate lyase activating enzyme